MLGLLVGTALCLAMWFVSAVLVITLMTVVINVAKLAAQKLAALIHSSSF